MSTTAEAPAPMQCQREAARFATRPETAAERADQIRANAVHHAVRLLGHGRGGRQMVLDLMLEALAAQAPLTFRRPTRVVAA